MWNNFVLKDFFKKWKIEAKDAKYGSVIIQHPWRASANESNMASKKAGYCVIRTLASFAGVAFMQRFA